MINQLKAIVDFKEPEEEIKSIKKSMKEVEKESEMEDDKKDADFSDVLKTRTDSLDLSTRTLNALTSANIRTLGGLARKKREDLLEIEGMGQKGLNEIKEALSRMGITLK